MGFEKNDPVYTKLYYEKNKERILNKIKQKVKCEICRCEVCYGALSAYNRSKKHLTALTFIDEINESTSIKSC